MKLVCSICVGNRLLSTCSIKNNVKYVKSTLALCKHPKNVDEFLIILFTLQNKTGTKYKLTNNVITVLTRFVDEGKTTIQFKIPAHDLFIKADVIQLKGFLHLLRRVLENKISTKELTLSSMSVTPVPQKKIPPKKMVIIDRSDLPTKGYPRTLEHLSINYIRMCKLCSGILQLQKLKVLDISDNCVEYLPPELNKLPLEQLNVSYNQLGKGSLKQWNWIGGLLAKNLKSLNLSNNNLIFLPEQIIKLQSLNYLNLWNNKLSKLPTGFGNLRNLRNLIMAYNSLTEVPGSMKRLHLETLDISNNNFKPISVAAVFPKNLPVCSLKESAARKVLLAKFSYSPETIPRTLVDYLDYAYYCVCGKSCFEVHLHHSNVLMLDSITQSYVLALGESNFVPMDCYFCSARCFRRFTHPPVLLNVV